MLPAGVASNYHNAEMMDRFAQEAQDRIQEFSQQNLANVAYAYGKAKHDAPGLLDKIAQRAIAIVEVSTNAFVLCHQCHMQRSCTCLLNLADQFCVHSVMPRARQHGKIELVPHT